MKHIFLVIMFINIAIVAQAEVTPSVSSADDRVRSVVFQDGQVYRINTEILKVTTINFGNDETIIGIALGDSAGFKADQLSPTSVAIKPVIAGAVTNLTISTSRRNYVFDLYEGAKNPMYIVNFSYPTGPIKIASAVTPANENSGRYLIQSKNLNGEFVPVKIWDDGMKTYMKFPSNRAIPAVFKADANGREFTVNSNIENGVMIIPSRSDRWVLRLGDEYVCVWSKKLIDNKTKTHDNNINSQKGN